jgi:tetratricopeptide (TPR) repeat protein
MNYKMPGKYAVVFLLLGAMYSISFAQNSYDLSIQHGIDSLGNVLKIEKDDTDKINTLNNLSHRMSFERSNYIQADSLARVALSLSTKLNFQKGTSAAYGNIGLVYYYQSNYSEALKAQSQSLDIAENIGYKQGVAYAYKNMGLIYGQQGNYPEALKSYSMSLKIMEDISDKDGTCDVYGDIGVANYEEGNFVEASKNLLKSLKIAEELGEKDAMGSAYLSLGNIALMYGNPQEAIKDYTHAEELGGKQVVKKAYGNTGYIYDRQGNYPEAIKSQLACLKISEEIGDKRDVCGAYVNLGNIYYDQGNIKESFKSYLKGLEISKETGDKHEMCLSYVNIGSHLVPQKQYSEAIKYLDSAIALSKNINEKDILRDAYSSLADIGEITGNYKIAYEDYQIYIAYRDSIMNQKDIKKITQMEVKYEFDKREDSIKAIQEKKDIIKTAEIKRKSIITYSMVVILLLALISATLLMNRQEIKRKKDKIIFEKNLALSENEKNLLNLEKQRMEDELSNAKVTLDEYIKSLVEKNELLEQFKADVEKLTNLQDKELDEQRIKNLEHLNKVTILTDEDWNKFKLLFEQVHKDFFKRLRDKIPDLTQAEMRLICLTKLQIGTKQMASILGVSFATIRQARYRLRKKLDLSEEDSIDDIVESV